jgi:hypothetical protein
MRVFVLWCVGFGCVWLCWVSAWRASLSVRLDFHWLQVLCMSAQLSGECGDPPRETGMSSSTSGLIGCGMQPGHGWPCGVVPAHLGVCCPGMVVRVLSMGWPHSAQWVSRARMRARSCLRRWPFCLRGSGFAMGGSPRGYVCDVSGVGHYGGTTREEVNNGYLYC